MKIKNTIQKGSLKNKSIPIIKQSHGHLEVTPQKIKEAAFQLIENHIHSYETTLFFDLFSGSGQIGIEALSRNIQFTYFIEADKERYKTILTWLQNNYLEKNFKFLQLSATDVFKKLAKENNTILTQAFERVHNNSQIIESIVFYCDMPYNLTINNQTGFEFIVNQFNHFKKTVSTNRIYNLADVNFLLVVQAPLRMYQHFRNLSNFRNQEKEYFEKIPLLYDKTYKYGKNQLFLKY